MPIFKYDADVKTKIIDAARGVRANDRGWDEALMVAKQHGYRGGLPGLKKIIREADPNNVAVAKKKRGPGRPRKIVAATAQAPAPAPANGMNGIHAMINGIVKNRVAGVLAKIRAVLDEAEKELR